MPWAVEELEGAAEGADVDPLALFACTVEEIWYEPRTADGGASIDGRCSDLVAAPPATADGHVLVAHNNDLSPHYRDELVAIERSVPGDPKVFTIGNGIWISVGWNSAGLSLTGNELSPNDEGSASRVSCRCARCSRHVARRHGRHRAPSRSRVLVQQRAGVIRRQRGERRGLGHIRRDDGAGRARSSGPHQPLRLRRDAPLRGRPAYARRSAIRYSRAEEPLAARPDGTVTGEGLREILSDHEHAPDSLCRHADHDAAVRHVLLVRRRRDRHAGHVRPREPCDSVAQEFAFAN
jgi:hypothetical protein